MTQKEILQYNRMCAEFLGYKNLTPDDKDFNIYENEKGMIIGNKIYTLLETMSMRFHSDWNWIMEVVEAIEIKFPIFTLQWEYDDREEFSENGKYLADWFTLYPKDEILVGLSDLRSNSRQEAVVHAINQFLIWYEQNKEV